MISLYWKEEYKDHLTNPSKYGQQQIFEYTYHNTGDQLIFDIEKARQLVTSNHDIVIADDSFLEAVAREYDYEQVKLNKADCSRDGIAVFLYTDVQDIKL